MNNHMLDNTTQTAQLPVTSQAQGLLALGRQEGWIFQALGHAPMPQKAVRLQDWLIVPAQLDNSAIPDRAMERIQSIYLSGLRPKGFVLVHEAPMQIGAPEHNEADVVEGDYQELRRGEIEIDLNKVADTSIAIVSTTLKVAASAIVAVASLVLPALFFAGTVLLDPILVAVTEDDAWIEIDRWIV